jgi:two-component system, LuxR family, sensor kinase FixL
MAQSERRKRVPLSKAQLDALLDAAVDAIILIGTDGHITLFNHAAERLFGYTADEVLGHNVNCLMPQPYHAEHDSYLKRYQATGQARIIGIGREVTGRRKDGSTFPIELSVGEVSHEDNRGFVGIIRDITQRKALENQLRQQGDELRMIFESAPTAIAVATVDEKILNHNHSWQYLLGYVNEDQLKLSIADIVHAEDYPSLKSGINRLMQERVDTWRTEARLVTQTGEAVHAQVQIGLIRADGKPQYLILELVDRTAQARAEQEVVLLRENLAHMARVNTMGEMATGIAHELNQPLTAIGTYAQAARRIIGSGAAEPEEIMQTLDKISAQSERAGEVIRRLRAMLVRNERKRESTEAAQLIRDIARLAEIDLRDRNVSLRLMIGDGLPPISVDKIQIQQVIINLLRNAMEAMQETSSGHEITLSTRLADDRMLEIGVSDLGPGIEEAVAGQIFDTFYTTKAEGLGMGLAICRSILQSHGGDLTFCNNRYGGATFTIHLPVDEEGWS